MSRIDKCVAVLGLVVLTPVTLTAQTDARELVGCYRLELEPAAPESNVPRSSETLRRDIEFKQPAHSGRLVILDNPRWSNLSYWQPLSADSLVVFLYLGSTAELMQTADDRLTSASS